MGQRNRYIPTLDGWRGLSVICVVLYHGRDAFFRSDPLLMRLFTHGDTGVDIFFAISGFLICGLLLNEYERDGGISLRRFYIRRSFRILPAYYAAIAGITALALFGVIRIKYTDLPSCVFFYRNYRLLGPDQAGGFFTAHFWSLAIEEHFYLIWPALLIAVKPKRAGKVALLLAIAVAAWRSCEAHFQWFSTILIPSNLLARTDAKADALLWGCLAAIYFPTIKRYAEGVRFNQLWLPILMMLLAVQKFHAPGEMVLESILIPALVLSTIIQPGSLLGRFLAWRPMCWVGTVSYSIYLWQEIFLPQFADQRAAGVFQHLQKAPYNLIAILACACLSRYLIELPMVRLGHRLSEAPSEGDSSRQQTLSPKLSLRGI
jgi:peptidoglycan/LPS O-acetylase OafA/YrhL